MASLDDQMSALDAALASPKVPEGPSATSVHCQVCDTEIDAATGEAIEPVGPETVDAVTAYVAGGTSAAAPTVDPVALPASLPV